MSRANEPAFPTPVQERDGYGNTHHNTLFGLTVREAVALQIFAEAVTQPTSVHIAAERYASESFVLADVFIAEMTKQAKS